ncbi:squalene/phytoene synthase family protein [Elusimicrobiota bacterium]
MKASSVTSRELLGHVSRSFALVIPMLEPNKVAQVENQYLLARFMDTIEDSNHSIEDKEKLISEFFLLLMSENTDMRALLDKTREKTINDHDKVLIDNFGTVLRTFMSFDDAVKNVSVYWLREMNNGMIFYQKKPIETFEDLDQYCFYVAGTVGRYLTALIKLKDNIALDESQAESFGRYLQKVNIIKDFRSDQKEGRNFWPTILYGGSAARDLLNDPDPARRLSVLKSMIDNAMTEHKATFDYIISIPNELKGFRQFCQIAAIMGTESLRKMRDNDKVFHLEGGVKISKLKLFEILSRSKLGKYDNKVLKKYRDTKV